jgi:hypothetical protein
VARYPDVALTDVVARLIHENVEVPVGKPNSVVGTMLWHAKRRAAERAHQDQRVEQGTQSMK